ncbi:tetratricopeptide repeat-containing hybrid sensor histidine kinase/response regulator [Neotamlana nanhaiensis]|uniref:tetratricopeptide repeat-containing hybrid sensor histidine kinase/response regulator n=1 Tax=Neotamlana nanhaiensis TaxID=1382798 RepID=UPI000699F649|nr:ATP-binding protein [Tamlana nanhaiensis]
MKKYKLTFLILFTVFCSTAQDNHRIKIIDNESAPQFYALNTNIVNSFKNFLKAKSTCDSINDFHGSAIASYNIGRIYGLMEDYKSAETYYKEAVALESKITDNYLFTNVYLNLGKISKTNKLFSASESYLNKALNYSSKNLIDVNAKSKSKFVELDFVVKITLSELYIDSGTLDKAFVELLKVSHYFNTSQISPKINALYNFVYGEYYFKNALYNKAILKYNATAHFLADETSHNSLVLLSKTYYNLSLLYDKINNIEEAYQNLLKHRKYNQILQKSNYEKNDVITKTKFLIEDYKNDAQIEAAKRLQQEAITNKFKRVNNINVVILLLMLLIILVIWKSYDTKTKQSRALHANNIQLKIEKNAAIKTAELKSKFISNVSHELRTPLYGVTGITSLLLEKNNLDSSDRKYLKSLKYSGDYLLNLINDILEVGKMEANKITLKNTSVNIRVLVNEIVKSFNFGVENSTNKIIGSVDNLVPKFIKCDKVRLSQILINLMSNSIKFTTNGEINLRVKLQSLNHENVTLCFEVEDTGKGIPEDKIDSVFDKFSQLENSNLNYQGTGLGLSITKNLVELFGSKIKIKSEVGIGTKISFDIDFKIAVEALGANPKQNKLNNKTQFVGIPIRDYNILIAEDNKINQVVTKNLLTKKGFQCDVVENGKEALEAAKNKRYNLILMDINMPIMNGKDATILIRKFNQNIPIIALTAANIEEIANEKDTIGFTDIITKPFDNYEFYQIIETLIQSNSSGNLNLENVS